MVQRELWRRGSSSIVSILKLFSKSERERERGKNPVQFSRHCRGKCENTRFPRKIVQFSRGCEDKLKIACTCLKQIRRSAMGGGRESFFAVFATPCPEYVGGLRADDGVSPMERATRNALLIVFIRIYSLQLIPPASTRTNRNHGNVLIHDRSNNIVYSARLVRRVPVVDRPGQVAHQHRFLIRPPRIPNLALVPLCVSCACYY